MPNKFEMISGGKINRDTVEIVAIIDKSGSMARIKEDVVKGLNSFIDEQKKVPGKANMSIIFFSHGSDYRTVEEYTPIEEVKNIEVTDYVPKGGTALLDAIGRTIDDMLKTFNSLSKEKIPEKVIFVILTDGDERDSIKYKREEIFKKIKVQEEKGWKFVYLGANQDAISEGSSFGIKQKNAMSFDTTSKGIDQAYSLSSTNVISYRSKPGN